MRRIMRKICVSSISITENNNNNNISKNSNNVKSNEGGSLVKSEILIQHYQPMKLVYALYNESENERRNPCGNETG
jgi:hypothetical protein